MSSDKVYRDRNNRVIAHPRVLTLRSPIAAVYCGFGLEGGRKGFESVTESLLLGESNAIKTHRIRLLGGAQQLYETRARRKYCPLES